MASKFPVAKDIAERVIATFVVSVLGLATSDAVGWQDVLKLDNWKLWSAAGLVTAFSLLKNLITSKIGGKGASAVPSVTLAPEDEVASDSLR
jgi:hypothetical protein